MSDDIEDEKEHERQRQAKYRQLTRKTRHLGYDRERTARVPFPGFLNDPHTRLVNLLTLAFDDSEYAEALVDALDAYLLEGSSRMPMSLGDRTPNYKSELEKARNERDAAIECAERVMQQMQATLNALRNRDDLEIEPQKTNGHSATSDS
jgi:hypothetical protein